MEEAITTIEALIKNGQPHQVTTVNPEFIMRARTDHAFRRVINHSDLAVPDGVGLVIMGKLTRRPFRQRVAGVDLTYAIAKLAAQQGWSIFLLDLVGGRGGGIEAAKRLQETYPELKIAGAYAGSADQQDNETICNIIKKANPTILLVAFGAPAQDLWISRNQTQLNIPLAIGVGGTLDFIAGIAKRAPKWMQTIGIEWFWRLVQEPWRWRRMLALPKFAVLALGEGVGLVKS
jgi:N-acetylglucosaminyldiphosphoundecaprenol N-acetyl-beta-D-mannosaminyltransferase